ncbi:Lipoprotein, putative [Shewanella piezotolerans WP3]|uniref:Lipoprotein, putative n=1 Tax=Shewanella piezotolerans (strain WP3 / JCM 13877) TaxID=225849 RepID=B8CKR8_SHEPW|nr:GNA1162 family protein [Shewanella piezotolerans]ACJ28244.1 Lipoprotein, putative [Shewanella piezotolerans WP3]
MRLLITVTIALLISGCAATTTTKEAAFPEMYSDVNRQTMLIVPVINETTAAEAPDFLNATVAQPLANKGYYVLPVPIVSNIFKEAGIVDGTQLKGIPFSTYKDKFGAESILFIKLKTWETNYMVISGNVTVGMEYVLVSADTNNVLWSYQNTFVLDTSSSSGNILADLVVTAITTAATDYVPVARRVHANAVTTLPVGEYHPKHLQDGKDKNVIPALATAPVERF